MLHLFKLGRGGKKLKNKRKREKESLKLEFFKNLVRGTEIAKETRPM
jgi:hypothetical protein